MPSQYLRAAGGQSSFDALKIACGKFVPHSVNSFLRIGTEIGFSCSGLRLRFFNGRLYGNGLLCRLATGLRDELRLWSGITQTLGDIGQHLSAPLQCVRELALKQLHQAKVFRCTSSIETRLSVNDVTAQRFQLHPLEFAHPKVPDDWDTLAA